MDWFKLHTIGPSYSQLFDLFFDRGCVRLAVCWPSRIEDHSNNNCFLWFDLFRDSLPTDHWRNYWCKFDFEHSWCQINFHNWLRLVISDGQECLDGDRVCESHDDEIEKNNISQTCNQHQKLRVVKCCCSNMIESMNGDLDGKIWSLRKKALLFWSMGSKSDSIYSFQLWCTEQSVWN